MVADDLQRQSSGTLKSGLTASNGTLSTKKQTKLRRNSAGAGRAVTSRKNSATEHVSKLAPGLAVASMRKSVSQDDFVTDANSTDDGLQRPTKPLQVPLQVPLQLPAGRTQLAAVGTRKWLKIAADGTTSILQACGLLPTPQA